MGSAPSRFPRTERCKCSFLSSLFICGASASHAPTTEMEDDQSELLVNAMKHSDPVVDGLQSLTKESSLASSRTGIGGISERSSKDLSEDRFINTRTSNQGKWLCNSNELVPPHQVNLDYRSNDTASTSYEDQSFSDAASVHISSSMDVANGSDYMKDGEESQIGVEVICPSSSSHLDELFVESRVSERMGIRNYQSGSAFAVSSSPVSSESSIEDTFRETIPPGLGLLETDREQGQTGGSVLHVDAVSIFPSSSIESNHEARRNSRRLFWDTFSRLSSRSHSDSQTLILSRDGTDGPGSHDERLLDINADFFDAGIRGYSGNMGSRIHGMNGRYRHSRSEVWERLLSGRERGNPQAHYCPSGIHPNGLCSCESNLIAEESGTRTSISRIVMLAEALFEVLDEIHRQPVSLTLSVASLPAPEAVVDSFLVKSHRRLDTSKSTEDAAQCYICLSEYEEGDKIRVLPCQHEFHMSCVDKWLKDIHGVCPLCRGDVREGFVEGSVSNTESPSLAF